MEFASVFFLWVFLPAVLTVYYSAYVLFKNSKKRTQVLNLVLLAFSLIFYGWAGLKELLFFIVFSLANFAMGLWIEHNKKKKKSVQYFTLSAAVLTNVLILCFFKYFNTLVTLAEIILPARHGSWDEFVVLMRQFRGTGLLHMPTVVMPLAFSFIAFQSISYICDIFFERCNTEHNFIRFMLFESLFCQLVQGPIMRYGDLEHQLTLREHGSSEFSAGVRRFAVGLSKKVLIANTLGVTVNQIWSLDVKQLCTQEAWLGILFYSLQLYYDFSGYSDMAVGIGKMFGFRIAENFNVPYCSQSIQEFWRRWHISLSSWLRDYVYIPLGGSRKGRSKTLLNLMIVFFVTGIWHGASMTFLVWGLYFGVLSVLERIALGKILKRNPFKLLNWMYAMLAVMLGWVIFKSPDLQYAFQYYGKMFSSVPIARGVSLMSYFSAGTWAALMAGIVWIWIEFRNSKMLRVDKDASIVQELCVNIASVVLVAVCIAVLMNSSYLPSIYAAF